MKKRIFAPIVGCMLVGLMAYIGYCGCIAYENDDTSDLLLANVEALTNNVEFWEDDDDPCPGQAIYSEVGKKIGKKEVRTHLVNDLDRIQLYSTESCYANGRGTLSGTNADLYKYSPQGDPTFEKCIGPQFHNSLFD